MGKDLFGFGYDFRQSNLTHAAALMQRLRAVHAQTGQRVDVVSHSMGGLVVKGLLVDHPEEFGELVANWVSIAAPFGGAPGFGTDALLTGVQFAGSIGAYFFVDRGTFRQGCVQSPAVYELLPPLDFRYRGDQPSIKLWLSQELPPGIACAARAWRRVAVSPEAHASAHRSNSEPGPDLVRALPDPVLSSPPLGWREAHEYTFALDALPELLRGVLEGNSVSVGGKPRPMPYNQAVAECARASQRLWRAAALPAGSKFFSVYGTGYDTPYSLQYGSWWFPVTDLPSLPHANAGFTYTDGDGTVPVESALADGLEATERLGVKGLHRPLISMQSVWDQVLTWLGPDAGGEPWHMLVPSAA